MLSLRPQRFLSLIKLCRPSVNTPSFRTIATSSRPRMAESQVKRNPHPDFKQVEASRPDWESTSTLHYTKTPSPGWKFGDGSNHLAKEDTTTSSHVSIDPSEQGRPMGFNYKLLVSGIVPRPIAFISTRSKDGITSNLAPFSFFNMVNSDPPLFVVGFSCGIANAKDTLRNIIDTEECVINIISDSFIEAANATAIDVPYGTSEWGVSGLTPVYDCETVGAARVRESVFSVEAKLDTMKEYSSKLVEGKKTGVVVTLEGTRFWVREDALSEERNMIDPEILRPMCRLGGISYGRVTHAMELPRPSKKELEEQSQ